MVPLVCCPNAVKQASSRNTAAPNKCLLIPTPPKFAVKNDAQPGTPVNIDQWLQAEHHSLRLPNTGAKPFFLTGLRGTARTGISGKNCDILNFVRECNPESRIEGLLDRFQEPFDLGPLRGVGRQTGEQIAGRGRRFGAAVRFW